MCTQNRPPADERAYCAAMVVAGIFSTLLIIIVVLILIGVVIGVVASRGR